VSVHIPSYVLLYNLSAVIVWRKSRVTWLCFWGKKWSVHAFCLPQKHVFERYFKDSLVCIRQFCRRYLTVAEIRKYLPRWNELLLILSIWSVTMVHLVSRTIVMWFNFCSNSQPPLSQNTHAQKVMSHYTLAPPVANNAKSRHTLCLSTVLR